MSGGMNKISYVATNQIGPLSTRESLGSFKIATHKKIHLAVVSLKPLPPDTESHCGHQLQPPLLSLLQVSLPLSAIDHFSGSGG